MTRSIKVFNMPKNFNESIRTEAALETFICRILTINFSIKLSWGVYLASKSQELRYHWARNRRVVRSLQFLKELQTLEWQELLAGVDNEAKLALASFHDSLRFLGLPIRRQEFCHSDPKFVQCVRETWKKWRKYRFREEIWLKLADPARDEARFGCWQVWCGSLREWGGLDHRQNSKA